MTHDSDKLRKAAILISALDTDAADRLLDQMPAEQAAAVRHWMVELDTIDPEEQRSAMAEFVRSARGSTFETWSLPRSLPATIAPAKPHVKPPTTAAEPGRPFEFLDQASTEAVMPLLGGEHPQTIALVLSHLPEARAAELIAALPQAIQAEVLRRLGDLEEADIEVVREVEAALRARIEQHLRDERRREQGTTTVARILSAAAPHVRHQLLPHLRVEEQHRIERPEPPPRTATFADLEPLSPLAWRMIFAQVDRATLQLALLGTSPELFERLLQALPKGEAVLWRYQMHQQGPLRLSDIDRAQHEVAAQAEELGLLESPLAQAV